MPGRHVNGPPVANPTDSDFALPDVKHREFGARLNISPFKYEANALLVDGESKGKMTIGSEGWLNGCFISSKCEVTTGTRTWLGPGTHVYDSDQHDFDDVTPERSAPVRMGDHIWVGARVMVMKGVTIGSHSIIGAHSLVTRDVPEHSVAHGIPAKRRGEVGDRTRSSAVVGS